MENNTIINENNISDKRIVKNDIVKKAWFAPVSMILGILIQFANSASRQAIGKLFDSGNLSFTSLSCVNNLLVLLSSLIFFAATFGVFSIAFSSFNKRIKRTVFPVFLFPIVLNIIGSNIVSAIFDIIYIANNDLSNSTSNNSSDYQTFAYFAMMIALTVVSYFVTTKYLSGIAVTENVVENVNEVEEVYAQELESINPQKSKAVAGVLCFFLGVLGIHRFYIGKVGTGLIWMFTGGLFGFGAVIDFFIIIFGGMKDSEGRELS